MTAESGMKIFEIQQIEVMFDMEPNKMVILRDITELV